MADAADLFGVLSDIADGPRVSEQGGITAALMRRLHEKGMSLKLGRRICIVEVR